MTPLVAGVAKLEDVPHRVEVLGGVPLPDAPSPRVNLDQHVSPHGPRVAVRRAALLPTLKKALPDDAGVVSDCPVDYAENMKLTNRLKAMKSPL